MLNLNEKLTVLASNPEAFAVVDASQGHVVEIHADERLAAEAAQAIAGTRRHAMRIMPAGAVLAALDG